LGVAPHDVPLLVSKGLLKPLGDPNDNAVKYFARVTLEELSNDVKWISRARAAIYDYWRMKNAGRASAEYQMGNRAEDAAQQIA
jgi:hypothetical protein